MHERLESVTASAFASREATVSRVALLSVHTCPLDQPGIGDSGGMNVYVRSVARRLAEMGVAVDIFTRWSGKGELVREVDPGVRVIHLVAGPDRPVPKEELDEHVCEFLYSLLRFESEQAAAAGLSSPMYDAVHSHYWLSGRAGRLAAERWNVPLIQSFHTLGRVKNINLAPGDEPEAASRIAAEERIVEQADCILAPTVEEARDLVRLYAAAPERVRVVTPGVDTDVFKPGDRLRAKGLAGLEGKTVVLFAGRFQLLKSPDLAVEAIACLNELAPQLDVTLLMLGGPSGRAGRRPEDLEKHAASLGIADRIVLRDPVPHEQLPDYYRAADVVLVPSRTESFGLVALEASACGTPVVATDVGGLRTAVRHGVTGLLVPGRDPEHFARALAEVLTDRALATAMGDAGSRYARRYDWRRAAADLLAVYEERSSMVAEAAGR
ncbi:MAG TPA: D-inositol-3-phosphate glycosyltransferase [Actinomycetota bacterium]|nr:D-inositol-3-phosphate glycosyltransferase [Actinomycetota bacterium]